MDGKSQKPHRLKPAKYPGYRWETLPAFVHAGYAAVVLVSSVVIEHPRVHNMPNWHVQVVGEEILQNVQSLSPRGLQRMREGTQNVRTA